MSDFDVIVIGAGAAGLSAAASLATSGRIMTCRKPGLPMPIELGAEFVHGRSTVTSSWLRRANSLLIDAPQQRWQMKTGKLHKADSLFEEMQHAFARLRRPAKDLPFADFLDESRAKLSTTIRQFARALAEGFDAADLTQLSTLQILEEWSGSASANAPTFRPSGGYGALIDCIAHSLDPERVHLSLNTVVQEVQWRRGHVTVAATKNGNSFIVTAPQAVIALPLAVLQVSNQLSNAVLFSPALAARKNALDQLATGPVIKVVLHFRHAFWEEADNGRYADSAFFMSPGITFPTLWTALPARAPLLIAWTGGPDASRISGWSDAAIVQEALDSVQTVFRKHRTLHDDLQSAHFHNWQTDPFAGGAYSYVTAGGSMARKQLAKPLHETLFFAGEAMDTQGEAATVAGALSSGERAARQITASHPAGHRTTSTR
ncbi:MAG: NAD(P)/FAD-dependent oxidoreductase [Steroidobacter sp.]